MPLTNADIDNLFTYHRPFGDQPGRYTSIRFSARELARTIAKLCPESREKSLAITHLQTAIMFANAAIAINEKEPVPDEDHDQVVS
jgi:hypothetical protein